MLEIKYVTVLSWKISGEFHPDSAGCLYFTGCRILLSGSGTSLSDVQEFDPFLFLYVYLINLNLFQSFFEGTWRQVTYV